MPRFIVVTGRPGAGKTTLATELAARTGATHVAIDDYESWAQVLAKVSRAGKPCIVEGCRVPTRLLQHAEHVIHVEAPRGVVERRLRQRGWSSTHIASVMRERYTGDTVVDGTLAPAEAADTLPHGLV